MHKKVTMLCKASDKEEAEDRVNAYMQDIVDTGIGRIDYYEIGGRWIDDLFPKKQVQSFKNWIKINYPKVIENGKNGEFLTKEDELHRIIQNRWEEFGLQGLHLYTEDYSDTVGLYNTVNLAYCIDRVKEDQQDLTSNANRLWQDCVRIIEGNSTNILNLDYRFRYNLSNLSDILHRLFQIANVFNLETDRAEDIPETMYVDWYATVVDYHY